MKKGKYLLLCSAFALTLTSCTFLNFVSETPMESLTVDYYQLTEFDSSVIHAEDEYLKGSAKLKYIKEEQYLPYITIEEYMNLLPFRNDFTYEVTRSSRNIYVTVGTKDYENGAVGTAYCMVQIDTSFKEISVAGSATEALILPDDIPEGLLDGLNYNAVYKNNAKSYNTYSYKNYGIKTPYNSGNRYFPLAFVDTFMSGVFGIHFHYNLINLYSYVSETELASYQFNDNGANKTIFDKEKEIAQIKFGSIKPDYLIFQDREIFMFLMENYYGLKTTRGISSMKSYYQNQGWYDFLLNQNSNIRGKAYSNCLNLLNDDHTGVISNVAGSVWGEYADTTRGEKSISRSITTNNLRTSRQAKYTSLSQEYGSVLYSSDEKVAMILFDSFDMEDIAKVRTDFNLIKQKGTVKDVIIDISTNGGGYLFLLFKIQALISKDGQFIADLWDDNSGAIYEYYGEYDTNLDGDVDENDYYGDDFNFYLLCSDASFSCGNAFPCYAKIFNDATIIGEKSGGGECMVDSHILPNMFGIAHSGNLHIGRYDSDTRKFNGFEGGAKVDISVDYEHYFDLEYLENIIK